MSSGGAGVELPLEREDAVTGEEGNHGNWRRHCRQAVVCGSHPERT